MEKDNKKNKTKINDIEIAKNDEIEEQKREALIKRENFEKDIKNLWGHSAIGLEAKKAAMTMLATKTGMYTRIPLVCKSDECPYANSCIMLNYGLAPFGEACPIEAAQIELRFQGYNEQFDLESASFTDKNLVSEIINLDVMAERCKALIAKEGVPVVDVVAGIAENGEAYSRPEVSKYWDAYERTLRRREELLQLMKATRKDQKDDIENKENPLDIINKIINNGGFVEDKKPDNVIDIEKGDYIDGAN